MQPPAHQNLREAAQHDLPFIQSVLNAPGNLDKLEGYSDAHVSAVLDTAGTPVYVWEENGWPQGFCWLTISDDGTKIEEFGVRTPGHGVGHRFFSAVLNHVSDIGLARPVWLAVAADNYGAVRFYERFGFVTKARKSAVWHRRKGPVADALIMHLATEPVQPQGDA